MASERHNEKTMRNPEDHEEDFSNNLERGAKPKKGIHNPVLPSSQQYPDTPKKTPTEGFHSKNEEIPASGRTQFQGENDRVPQQKEKKEKNVGLSFVVPKSQAANDVASTTQNEKKGGTQYSNSSKMDDTERTYVEAAPLFVAGKNIEVPLSSNEARGNKISTTIGSYRKEEPPKKDMLLKEHKDINGGTQDCDPSKRIATEEAKKSDYTAPKNTPLPFYRPGEKTTSTFPNNNPSKMAPDHQEKVLPSSQQYPDPPKETVIEGILLKEDQEIAAWGRPQVQGENYSVPQQKEKKGTVEVWSNIAVTLDIAVPFSSTEEQCTGSSDAKKNEDQNESPPQRRFRQVPKMEQRDPPTLQNGIPRHSSEGVSSTGSYDQTRKKNKGTDPPPGCCRRCSIL